MASGMMQPDEISLPRSISEELKTNEIKVFTLRLAR